MVELNLETATLGTELQEADCCSKVATMWRPRGGGGGGGTRDFKWRGWSKDFFGFEIFDSGIFFGYENLASIFLDRFMIWVEIFWGY